MAGVICDNVLRYLPTKEIEERFCVLLLSHWWAIQDNVLPTVTLCSTYLLSQCNYLGTFATHCPPDSVLNAMCLLKVRVLRQQLLQVIKKNTFYMNVLLIGGRYGTMCCPQLHCVQLICFHSVTI
ncbi:MAG: hypothetical protein PHW00_01565 [Clostridia bacterium]|nr:hypothetical protein [Clostridia bacterium]